MEKNSFHIYGLFLVQTYIELSKETGPNGLLDGLAG